MNKDTRIWPEKEETGMQEGEKNLTSANMQIYIAIKTHTHTPQLATLSLSFTLV